MAFEAERLSAGVGSFLFTHSSRTQCVRSLTPEIDRLLRDAQHGTVAP